MKPTFASLLFAVLLAAGCATNKPVVKEEAPPPPPKEEPKPVEAKEEPKPEPPKPLVLETIRFSYNDASLSADARAALRRNVEALLARPEVKIVTDGHCDERGTEQYNVDLGWKRAYAVRDFLTRQGVEKGRLYPASYGRSRPAVVGTDESAWSQNRRVELSEKK